MVRLTIIACALGYFAAVSDQARTQDSAKPQKVVIVDKSSSDSSFLKFKRKLESAVATHDGAFLRSILDAKARPGVAAYEATGEIGVEPFLRRYPLDGKAKENIWSVLAPLLEEGCTPLTDEGGIQQPAFVCPALYAQAPDKPAGPDSGWSNYGVLRGAVPILKERNPDAAKIAVRSWEIVEDFSGTNEAAKMWESGWARVKTADGIEGFVRTSALSSPFDMRVFFEKKGNSWRLTFMGSGV